MTLKLLLLVMSIILGVEKWGFLYSNVKIGFLTFD